MEWETVERILIAIMTLGVLMALVGTVGEVLGWWNDIGEVLVTVGAIAGLVTTAIAVHARSSRHQVALVQRQVRAIGDAVCANGRRLATLDRSDTLDRRLDALDVVQHQFDRQTGVLNHQLAMLTEVCDRH